jgi:hypothetical protein
VVTWQNINNCWEIVQGCIARLTKVEVVVLRVTDDEKSADNVEQSYGIRSARLSRLRPCVLCAIAAQLSGMVIRTRARCVLSGHVSVLVPLNRSASLRGRGGATGKLLVKVDDSGHARTVGLAADSLYPIPISISIPSNDSTTSASWVGLLWRA